MADNSEIRKVAVLGTGIMGQSIAEFLTEKGVAVVLWGRSDASLESACTSICASRKMALRRKRIDETTVKTADSCLATTLDLDEAGTADLVIEAIVEDLAAKQELLSHLTAAGLVATNTSALKVAEIAESLSDTSCFFGMHFMNPATTVNLIELVWSADMAETDRQRVRVFCKQIERQTVDVADSHGMIVNRLLMLLINEASRMVEAGTATPQDIDKAIRLALGHPMGPASLADLIGLDTVETELAGMAAAFGERYTPSPLISRLVSEGHLGRKTRSGLVGCLKNRTDNR